MNLSTFRYRPTAMPRPKNLGPQTRAKFTRLIRTGVDTSTAALQCGFSRGRFYQLRKTDTHFRDEWDAADCEYFESVVDTFLEVIGETGNVTVAAETVGIPRRTFYYRRMKDPEFALRWAAAMFEFDDAVIRGGLVKELVHGHTVETLVQKRIETPDGEEKWVDDRRTLTTATSPINKLRYLQRTHPDFKKNATIAVPVPQNTAAANRTWSIGELDKKSVWELSDIYLEILADSRASPTPRQ